MSYVYTVERPWVFTEAGQQKLLDVLRKARACCKVAGAVRADRILGSGDVWKSMAVIDRLVEVGELREVPTDGAGQHRIFIDAHEYE